MTPFQTYKIARALLKRAGDNDWAADPAFLAQARQYQRQYPTSFQGSNEAATRRVAGGLQGNAFQTPAGTWMPGSEVGAGLPMGPTPGQWAGKGTARFNGRPLQDPSGRSRAPFAGEFRGVMGTPQRAPFDYRQRDAQRDALVAQRKTAPAGAGVPGRPAGPGASTVPGSADSPGVQRTPGQPGGSLAGLGSRENYEQHLQRITGDQQRQYNNQQAADVKRQLDPIERQRQENLAKAESFKKQVGAAPATPPPVSPTQRNLQGMQQEANTGLAARRSEQSAFMASLPQTSTSRPPVAAGGTKVPGGVTHQVAGTKKPMSYTLHSKTGAACSQAELRAALQLYLAS